MKNGMYLLILLILLVSSFNKAMNLKNFLIGRPRTLPDQFNTAVQNCNLKQIVNLLVPSPDHFQRCFRNDLSILTNTDLKEILNKKCKSNDSIRNFLESILGENEDDPVFFVKALDERLRIMNNLASQEGVYHNQAQGIFFKYFVHLNEYNLKLIREAAQTNTSWRAKHSSNVENKLKILMTAMQKNNTDVIINTILPFLEKLDSENQEDNQTYQQIIYPLINQTVDRAIQNRDKNTLESFKSSKNQDIYNKAKEAIELINSQEQPYTQQPIPKDDGVNNIHKYDTSRIENSWAHKRRSACNLASPHKYITFLIAITVIVGCIILCLPRYIRNKIKNLLGFEDNEKQKIKLKSAH